MARFEAFLNLTKADTNDAGYLCIIVKVQQWSVIFAPFMQGDERLSVRSDNRHLISSTEVRTPRGKIIDSLRS